MREALLKLSLKMKFLQKNRWQETNIALVMQDMLIHPCKPCSEVICSIEYCSTCHVVCVVICHLAPTISWLLLRSRASWEKSFTPGWENPDIHGLNAAWRRRG